MGNGKGISDGPRSSGSCTISFGLVNVPAKLYTAQSSHDLSFNQLHDECHCRVKQQPYVCTRCTGANGTPSVVEKEHMLKGFEFAKNQYVWFEPAELKALEDSTNNDVEIVEFVPQATVDPIFFEKSYFLGPDAGAQKAYRLLTDAMTKAGSCAVATYQTKGKEKLALVRVCGTGLMLHTLYYADEVRSDRGIDHGEGFEVKDAEVALAQQLIASLAQPQFDATKYEDGWRKKVLDAVEQKKNGETVTVAAAKPKAAVVDLMAALRASLAAKAAPAAVVPHHGGGAVATETEPKVKAKKGRKAA
jgi:DNA end-binding protein Ku